MFSYVILNGEVKLFEFKNGVHGYEFQRTDAWFIYKVFYGNLIIFSGLVQKFLQFLSRSGLHLFKSSFDLFCFCGDVYKIIFSKINPVTGGKTFQGVIISGFFSKISKKTFENVWHPVPGRTHIKGKTLLSKRPCAASELRIFFIYVHTISCFGHITCCSQRRKAGTDDRNIFFHMFNKDIKKLNKTIKK